MVAGVERAWFIVVFCVVLPKLRFLEGISCRGALLSVIRARVFIVGGDHGGSFGLGSLPRIVAACPGNWSRHESLGSFGVKRMSGRVPGVAVI